MDKIGRGFHLWGSVATLLFLLAPFASGGADPAEFFESKVRPVLAKNCFACHVTAHLGNLSMLSSETLIKGGNSGRAIVPGSPDDSLLIQAVSHTHPRIKMPPQSQLSPAEIDDLRTWIKAGAYWPASAVKAPAASNISPEQRSFWSFQPVRKPPTPLVKNKAWAKTAIDHFILASLEQKGLAPVSPAPRGVLLRRVYLDLIGLLPTPEQLAAFERDGSPGALAKVVDELLASPRYGERWGRHWLDVARYSDDKLNIVEDEPYQNAFRYRDWVIQAFNEDMPYDLFVKAQLAADLMPAPQRDGLLPALGFYGMSAQYQEDRPDVTGRAFLGLTVGCAQCHDHKFDPIPTRDYYALLGVFRSTRLKEFPLASTETVADYQRQAKRIEELQSQLDDFEQNQSRLLARILAGRTARYLPAAWNVLGPPHMSSKEAAKEDGLDQETLERWVAYLRKTGRDHTFLKAWDDLIARGGSIEEARQVAAGIQSAVLEVYREIQSIESQNLAKLGGAKGNPALAKIVLLPYPREKYMLWRALFGEPRTGPASKQDQPVLVFTGEKLDRFLQGEWKAYADELRVEIALLKKEQPPKYPFLHAIEDVAKPANLKVHLRGNAETLGEEAPRAFLSILSEGAPQPFHNGSGRLELAEAIVDRRNPLTARVMVNRLWLHHFGRGIVATPSNFGQLGERPTHPDLLDYLAARFIESGWSMKAMHREMVLSAAYALSAAGSESNLRVDPGNRLLWRSNLRRMDIEALRDSLLAASGRLDLTGGGPPNPLSAESNFRRTVYGFVSRRKLDETLGLFDFPVANDSSERRIETDSPLQRLFFLNSGFVVREAEALAERLRREAGNEATAQVRRAYQILFSRIPSVEELRLGLEFLNGGVDLLPRYTQALLATNEFQNVN